MENLQQEDTVSADRKERIIFDKNTGKSRKISSVVSRQNFNNTKYGNRNSPIEFVQGNAQNPEDKDENKVKKENMSLVSKILEAKKKKAEEACNEEAELTRELHEVLSADAQAGDWIHDFVHSDNPKFEGKSKKERIKMALGAYYAKQRNEEVEIEEAFNTPGKNPLKRVWVHGTGYNTHAIYGETHAGETVKVSGGHGYENAKAKAKRLADKHGLSSTSKYGVNFAQAANEEVEQISETPVTKAKPPYRPASIDPETGKPRAAPKGTYAYDQAQRALAKKSKSTCKEETMKSYNQFVEELDDLVEFVEDPISEESLLEYTPGPGGVTRVQGRSYGASYHDPEGDDDAWEKEGKAKPAAAAPAPKRGRGRPAGSYGTYKARSAETKAAAAAKSAASKAANKAAKAGK